MNLLSDWSELYQIRRQLHGAQQQRPLPTNPYRGTQPLHVVYGGAQLFDVPTLDKIADLARRHWAEMVPSARHLSEIFSVNPKVAKSVFPKMERVLGKNPVLDYRIDFEDGYGVRSNEEEDRDAVKTARAVAQLHLSSRLSDSIGIRIKALSQHSHFERCFRTLYLFLDRLLRDTGGVVPKNFVVTLPKVESRQEVASLVDLLELIESRSGTNVGTIQLELMVESGRGIFSDDGRILVPAMLEAARGRCRGIHLGVYDFLSTLGVAAPAQSLRHPWCQWVRGILLSALSDTGVFFSDGATLRLPVKPSEKKNSPGKKTLHSTQATRAKPKRKNSAEVRKNYLEAWNLSLADIEGQLSAGIYQGWDLHPHQIPIRYLAHHLFFEKNVDFMTERWKKFKAAESRAIQTRGHFDDEASIRGISQFFDRGLMSGAKQE